MPDDYAAGMQEQKHDHVATTDRVAATCMVVCTITDQVERPSNRQSRGGERERERERERVPEGAS